MRKKIMFLIAAIAFAIVPLSIFTNGNYSSLAAYTYDGGGVTNPYNSRLSMPFVNVSIEPEKNIDVDILLNSGIVEIKITDNKKGTVLFRKSVESAISKQERIDISDLPSGEYTIELKNKNTREKSVLSFVID